MALPVRRRERSSCSVRQWEPYGVDPDGVDASLDGGVLSVHIPTPEPARPHRVAISDASA